MEIFKPLTGQGLKAFIKVELKISKSNYIKDFERVLIISSPGLINQPITVHDFGFS